MYRKKGANKKVKAMKIIKVAAILVIILKKEFCNTWMISIVHRRKLKQGLLRKGFGQSSSQHRHLRGCPTGT